MADQSPGPVAHAPLRTGGPFAHGRRPIAESPNAKGGEKTGALDPNEKWGQGTDASHPISAIGGVDAETPTADTAAGEAMLLDDGEMTEMVDRLRESDDAAVDQVEGDEDVEPA